MWNTSISLLKGTVITTDEDGMDTCTEEWMNGIPASFKDTTRNDELMASQTGYKADQNIEIMTCNYNGEKILCDETSGDRYEVKRTYHPDKGMNIILTCERRERGG